MRNLFLAVGFAFSRALRETRMSMQVASDQTGQAAGRSTGTRQLLFIGEPKRLEARQKEREMRRALLGHQSRPLCGADQTA